MTALEIGLSRQNDAWSEAQIARNVKEAVLRQLGQPEANEPIYMISGETYFLHPTNEWAYSSSSMQVIDNRVDTQIRLRQALGALREVSYQLFAGDQILASAFEERPDMLCVPRQLAELLKLSLEDILQDFDAICSGDWRQRGVSPAEIRTFCVWRNRPHVLRRLPRTAPGLLPAHAEGRKGHSLHRLERTRFFSTKAPGPWWGATKRSGIATVGSARTPALPNSRSGSPGPGRSGVATSGAKTCEACGPSCSQRGTSPRWPSEDSANGPPCACERREATA